MAHPPALPGEVARVSDGADDDGARCWYIRATAPAYQHDRGAPPCWYTLRVTTFGEWWEPCNSEEAHTAWRLYAEQQAALVKAWKLATGFDSPGAAWAAGQGAPWQCSGCGHVTRAYRCPSRCGGCKREGYYSGSVKRADVDRYDAAVLPESLRKLTAPEGGAP